MAQLNPDGLPVEVAPNVVLRTPGLRGEVVVHYGSSEGTRGAEETREELVRALAHNEIEEDLTLEIRGPSESEPAVGSRAGGGADDLTVEVPDPGEGWAQVVLYESEDGLLSWHLPAERNVGSTTRGGQTLTYSLPRVVILDDEDDDQRGLLGAAGSKIIKVLTFRLLKEGASWVGDHFARKMEAQCRPHALVRFTPDCYTDAVPQDLTPAEVEALSGGRVLLFVHGFISSAYGAFHHLAPEVMAELHHRYDGRVLAFNHPTIGSSPVENVAWLAERLRGLGLPPLKVDVLSHSRGGLVSRVITERPALGEIEGRLNVRNLVMVATPNAGTRLAEVEHYEQLLNRLTSLLQLFPDNGLTDALDLLLPMLKQVAAGFFSGMDGVMSMNPKGPFLTEKLNRPGHTSATYFAAASDYEPPNGSKLLRIARDTATDLVFGLDDNDLVVPTQGVFTVPGASRFPIADPVVFDAKAGVDHSGYWTRPELIERLASWLPGS